MKAICGQDSASVPLFEQAQFTPQVPWTDPEQAQTIQSQRRYAEGLGAQRHERRVNHQSSEGAGTRFVEWRTYRPLDAVHVACHWTRRACLNHSKCVGPAV